MNKLKILLVFDSPYFKPRGYNYEEEFKDPNWATEEDVFKTLVKAGHEVSLLGLYNEISPILEEIKENRPDIVFNLTEVFDQKSHLDKNVAWIFEMMHIPYTGATPDSLLICNNKALSKKIMSFHRIRVPNFYVFSRGHRIWLPKRLRLPIIVKPLAEEASRGISQASVIDNGEALVERVKFIHESLNADAIAEEYIDGRELYISVIGDRRITVLPFREIKFGEFPEDEPRIATYKAKWDHGYRDKWGIKNVFAGRLPNGADKKIEDICKRTYRALNMRSYARFDIRITGIPEVYIIEPNANPSLFRHDELAQSAEKAEISYDQLLERIITLALQRKR